MPTSTNPATRSSPRAHQAFTFLMALLFTLTFSACNMQTNSFDSDKWKALKGASVQENKRWKMTEAFEKTVHVGMKRAEVTQLLGEPDVRRTDTEADVYELGASDLSVDDEYYEIRYKDGVVTSLHWSQR